jgi:lysozyme family protein
MNNKRTIKSRKEEKNGDFNLAWQFTSPAEGGYNPHDPVLPSNFGITTQTFLAAQKDGLISSSIASVKDIMEEQAQTIAENMYWDKIDGDELPQNLSVALFDIAYNSGVKKAVEMLQEVLGVTVDGIIGPITLEAIYNYSGDLVGDLIDARDAFYQSLADTNPMDLWIWWIWGQA